MWTAEQHPVQKKNPKRKGRLARERPLTCRRVRNRTHEVSWVPAPPDATVQPEGTNNLPDREVTLGLYRGSSYRERGKRHATGNEGSWVGDKPVLFFLVGLKQSHWPWAGL